MFCLLVNLKHTLRAAGCSRIAPAAHVRRGRASRGVPPCERKSPQGVRATPGTESHEKNVNDRPTGMLMYTRGADQFALLCYDLPMRLILPFLCHAL